jgi:putative acetyltransferase
MKEDFKIKRTASTDPDFKLLISHLDNELWNELKEDQSTYEQYNKVPDLQTAFVLYINQKPAACGCFKKYNKDTVEIKRMFVEKDYRGMGLSKIILEELEKWAAESLFKCTILETSIHFKAARTLYEHAGYEIIPNYDQYEGLTESVCMKKELPLNMKPSEFKDVKDIEYFLFEEDFVEKNIRCIPMIVRFKMDAAGIKLKLSEWSKFSVDERLELAKKICGANDEVQEYNSYLSELIKKYTGEYATALDVDRNPAWANLNQVPQLLQDKLKSFDWRLSVEQWKGLSNLQRFALLKLTKGGHENKNFPKAMKEFGLID